MHIENPPISTTFINVSLFSFNLRVLCLIYIFCFPHFDHDAYMHHALHVLGTVLAHWIKIQNMLKSNQQIAVVKNTNVFLYVLALKCLLSDRSNEV